MEFADRIKGVRSGGAQAAVGKRIRSPKAALGSSLGLLGSLPSDEVIAECLTEVERTEVSVRVTDAIERLTAPRTRLTQ